VFFQGSTFNVRGSVEFPPAADPHMHTDMLLKSQFFPVVEATFTAVGVERAPWTHPLTYLNRDLMIAIYLG
jgi:hypothetical protein